MQKRRHDPARMASLNMKKVRAHKNARIRKNPDAGMHRELSLWSIEQNREAT